MIRAYDNQYLDDAMKCLGEAMDYAANSCHMDMDQFMEQFIATGYAEQFAIGVPKMVSGLSGTELVMDVLTAFGTDIDFPQAQIEYDYSPAYWCGWILAYYQWYSGRNFKEIKKLRNTIFHVVCKNFVVTCKRNHRFFLGRVYIF